jgi:cytoskeletal protein CcmA (bactofilin family)
MVDYSVETLDENDFDTVLSKDIEFVGLLSFAKPFLIRGKVSGEIRASGALVIAEEAVVDADIAAPTVVVRGTVRGNVTAAERVEITASGKLVGDIMAPQVFMETGCAFNGSCRMPEQAPKAATV